MNKEINLITTSKNLSSKKERSLHILQYSAVIFLVFVILSSLILFILNTNSLLVKSLQDEKVISDNLVFVKNKVVTYFLIKNRIKDINDILKTRTNFEDLILQMKNAFPLDVVINAFFIKKGTLSFVVNSTSLDSIKKISDFLADEVSKKQLFKKITINSLVVDIKTEKYIFSVDAELL